MTRPAWLAVCEGRAPVTDNETYAVRIRTVLHDVLNAALASTRSPGDSS
ncbi:MAG TPA: hypothetical protein VH414_02740 [Lichenihabitans sp.]|jgi:hypothetical protein|nr:hypothetical protein [Lichenihabitans sp.]